MKSPIPAGNKPAVPQLTLPASLRRVLSCPYCGYEQRGIWLDTAVVPSARQLYPGGETVELHQHPDQRLFLFGGDTPSGVPCKHLIVMWGCYTWQNGDEGNGETLHGTEFDYYSPTVMAQKNGDLELFLAERVFTRACGKRFMPAVPARLRRVSKGWREPAGPGKPTRTFDLLVTAYFGLDVPKLFAELAVKSQEYYRHRAMEVVGDKR